MLLKYDFAWLCPDDHLPSRISWLQVARQQLSLQIRCARVGGVEIPNQKRIEYSLQYVFGVGHTTSKAILAETVWLLHELRAFAFCKTLVNDALM